MYHLLLQKGLLVSGALDRLPPQRVALIWFSLFLAGALTACIRTRPENGITPENPTFDAGEVQIASSTTPVLADDVTLISPTANPTRPVQDFAREYRVQPGDTLSGIASLHNVPLELLITANGLIDPNLLEVGQVIRLPSPPDEATSNFKIIPDSRLVRGPGSRSFDVNEFVSQWPGYIQTATDEVEGIVLSATEIVDRVSLEFSVDARTPHCFTGISGGVVEQ